SLCNPLHLPLAVGSQRPLGVVRITLRLARHRGAVTHDAKLPSGLRAVRAGRLFFRQHVLVYPPTRSRLLPPITPQIPDGRSRSAPVLAGPAGSRSSALRIPRSSYSSRSAKRCRGGGRTCGAFWTLRRRGHASVERRSDLGPEAAA